MEHSPFARRGGSPRGWPNRRRSTRVDYQTPIILTGHDATGRAFREETRTHTINLHGARIETVHQMLIGMQVGLENPRTGLAGKAVCVRVEDPAPGQAAGFVAVQLVEARNIWGLENPPADWSAGEGTDTDLAGAGARDLSSPAGDPLAIAFDLRFVEFERRSAQAMDSALQLLRDQAEATMRGVLTRFEARLAEIEAASEARLAEGVDRILAEAESSVEALRTEVAGQVAARHDGLALAVESALDSSEAEGGSSSPQPSSRSEAPFNIQPATKK